MYWRTSMTMLTECFFCHVTSYCDLTLILRQKDSTAIPPCVETVGGMVGVMIECIGQLDRGLRFAEVPRDSPEHGSNVLRGSF